jgi:hypothetical protein
LLRSETKIHAASPEDEKLDSMKMVSENSYLELYMDEKDTCVAVKVKKSGDTWFTNPVDAEEDGLATPYNKQLMKSQFSIKYYNESVQVSEMDNYNDSIKEEQFEISYQSDGVTITYTLGETASKLILPTVISEERYLLYFNQMNEKAQKQVKRNYSFLSLAEMDSKEKQTNLETYPSLKDTNIYILKSGTKDYKQEEIMEYFVGVGYTAEDMENDMVTNGYASSESKPYFIIPLTYRLDGENLVVSITPKNIQYNTEGYYLIDIDLMEYFGAAGLEDSGYIYVPDGSGALINLNNNKYSKPSYSSQVYGQDKIVNMMTTKKSEIAENLTIKMPVFGLKNKEKAFFAIIEDGDALADINADVSGRTNSFNNVYPGFTYLQNGAISLGDIIGSNSFQMYAKKPYDGDYKIRYAFLSGKDANYSGMANYYRRYLVNKGLLVKQDTKNNLPFYIDFVGAIDKTKSFFGIKYQSIEALTTYKQAADITENLINQGISNIKIKYTGWMNGGLGSEAPTKVNSVTQLNKGGLDLEEFMDNMDKRNIPVYTDVNLQFVYEDTLLDGYTPSKYAPRYFDKSIVKTGNHLIPNGFIRNKNINLISPFYINTIVNKFINGAKKYEVLGVSVNNLGTELFSDFMSNRFTDRQQAVKYNTKALSTLTSQYKNGILLNNTNVYGFQFASDILEVPMDSNGFYIIDESIPFYEMVLRGYVEYAGEPLNLSDDYTEVLLKSIETGAGIYFKWIYADNSAVKETDYDNLYSVHYGYWIEKAIDSYNRINQVFARLQGQSILSHEKIQSNVYKVTYEKGTEIVVNYNTYNVKYNGKTIEAKDFTVVKEEW